ncbi:MAG: rhodanese-like domain-containing protein [Elusimicrobia bacterium]|nr:rhodanese-like domain-containing protein [Elusimicrobiota bacterium]
MPRTSLAAAAFVIVLAQAAPTVRAEEKAEFPYISAEEMIAKTKGAPEKWEFVLIDARNRVEFEDAHIPGSINLPAELIKGKLPDAVKAKERKLVFYCNGPQCTKSHKAATGAKGLGYSQIAIFNGGMPAWGTFQQPVVSPKPLPKIDVASMPAAEAAKEIEKNRPFILDVRDKAEFPASHIKDSVNIPLDDIEARIKEVPDKAIFLVDHAGRQVLVAGRLLTKLGRKDLKRLDKGLQSWKAANLPLEEKKEPPSTN